MEMIEQTGVEYNLEDNSLSLTFDIGTVKLKIHLQDGQEQDLPLEEGEMIIETKDDVCKKITLMAAIDINIFDNTIAKTSQYLNLKEKIDHKMIEDAYGTEFISIEYVMNPDLLKSMKLNLEDEAWVDLDKLGIDTNINLTDTNNYYINDMSIAYSDNAQEVEFENIFEEEDETSQS